MAKTKFASFYDFISLCQVFLDKGCSNCPMNPMCLKHDFSEAEAYNDLINTYTKMNNKKKGGEQ